MPAANGPVTAQSSGSTALLENRPVRSGFRGDALRSQRWRQSAALSGPSLPNKISVEQSARGAKLNFDENCTPASFNVRIEPTKDGSRRSFRRAETTLASVSTHGTGRMRLEVNSTLALNLHDERRYLARSARALQLSYPWLVTLRRALGGRKVYSSAFALGMGIVACDGALVNLGQGKVSTATAGATASASAGTTATGGTSTTALNSGGQFVGSAGRVPNTNAGSDPGGVATSTAGRSQAGTTGQGAFTEPTFTNVTRVLSLSSIYEDDNPTLTFDMKELYFSSKNRPEGKGNVDVWVAKRDSADADFGEPFPVLAVSTVGIDNSPAISADGLAIWVGFAPATEGLGGYDIMQATRASRNDDFGTPVLAKELSSSADDIPRPLGYHDLIMPLASRRDNELYTTYFATRTSPAAPFGTPVLKSELIVSGSNFADAFLTDDGLTLYFARSVNSSSDIYAAYRATVNVPFGAAVALSTLNTTRDDRDPWLSPDGKRLYFSSDRDNPGTLNIYQADRVTN